MDKIHNLQDPNCFLKSVTGIFIDSQWKMGAQIY